MRTSFVCTVLLACVIAASAEIYFKETFSSGWEKRWTESDWKKSEGTQGKFKLTSGKWHGKSDNKGIQTSEDARFYAISSPIPEFEVKDKPLVLQYEVKHEQKLDCGGGYVKLLSPGYDASSFSGDTDYAVMFGPDICGTSTRRTHVILSYKGKNHLVKREVRCETDQLSHVYTLILRPDNTYEVLIDGKKEQSGSLYDDFDMLPPRKIADPSASKPADWVDEKQIPDPEDVKPEGWDDIPATIPDPEAVKPEDWDDETDGEWEVPQIPNPEYKGKWKPRMIPNPAYKGEWSAPEIDNPEYVHDDALVQRKVAGLGIELWQVKSGTIFKNIIVTDNEEEAKAFADETWGENHEDERAAFNKLEEERRQKEDEERKKAEEERKKAEAARKEASTDADDEDDDADEEDEDEDEQPAHKTAAHDKHDEL